MRVKEQTVKKKKKNPQINKLCIPVLYKAGVIGKMATFQLSPKMKDLNKKEEKIISWFFNHLYTRLLS